MKKGNDDVYEVPATQAHYHVCGVRIYVRSE